MHINEYFKLLNNAIKDTGYEYVVVNRYYFQLLYNSKLVEHLEFIADENITTLTTFIEWISMVRRGRLLLVGA